MRQRTLFYMTVAAATTFLLLPSCEEYNHFGRDYSPAHQGHYLHLSETSVTLEATGEQKSVNVEAVNPWQFTGMADWLTLSPTNGNGNTTIGISATQNPSGDIVRSNITVFESTDPDYKYNRYLSVTQKTAAPFIRVPETSLAFTASAFSSTIAVDANVYWNLSWDAEWLTATVTPDKKIIYISGTENTTDQTRKAEITLSGVYTSKVITIVQSVASQPIISENNLQFINTGGSFSLSITTEVAWTAKTSDESWLLVTPESGESGTSFFVITATPNNSMTSRKGYLYIYIGLRTVLSIPISQEGNYIEVTPEELTFSPLKDTKTIQINSNTTWNVLSKPDWVTTSVSSGFGKKELSVTVPDHWDENNRSGIIRIGQEGTELIRDVYISQQGRKIAEDVISLSFEADASSTSVDILEKGNWITKTSAEWIHVDPDAGYGNATLIISVRENSSTEERNGTVLLAGEEDLQTISINQKGKYFTVNTTDFAELPSRGGTHQIQISTNDKWTVSVDKDWILPSSTTGKGDQNISLTVLDNPSVNPRQGTAILTPLSIAQPIRIITKQAGRYLKVDATSVIFSFKGGISDAISINTDAEFSISASDEWINVLQTGKTFRVEVGKNETDVDREGKIMISMTGLNEGESYTLELPIIQKTRQAIDVEDFQNDTQWDILKDTNATISIIGFKEDSRWDEYSNHTVTITVKSFGEDKNWN